MNKLFEKLIAVMLVMTLAGVNLIALGMYSITYALSDSSLAEQDTLTQNENVEFNAYLEGGGHTVLVQPDSNETKLYLNIKVKASGYLKNASVTFQDVNFKIKEDFTNELIESVNTSNNSITLKQINNGSDVTIEVPVIMLDTDYIPEDNFAKQSQVVLNGIYFDKNGKENQVSKEIVNQISWKREAKATIKAEITKNIPYVENEKYGVMIQAKINSGIKDSTLPIKETNIEVIAPEISGTKPTTVYVSANQTKATNGAKDGVDFTEEQYTYHVETGMISIHVANEANENGQIAWKKDVQDEYLITFIFEGKEIYDEVMDGHITAKLNATLNATLYNSEDTVIQETIEQDIKMGEKLGTMVDFSMTTSKEIAKGNIYASYDAKDSAKDETNYFIKYHTIISNLDLTDGIEFVQGIDSFVREDNQKGSTTIGDKNYVYNKLVKVSEREFTKILGQEGSIELLDKEGNSIGTINQGAEKDNNGYFVLDISQANNNELTIKTSKPISVGALDIEVEKAISKKLDYSKKQMQDFVKMETAFTGKATTEKINVTKEMKLTEVKSVVAVEISPKDLSTAVENKKVELRAILDTSSISNALYKDPTLKIKLPSYVDKMVLKNAKLIMNGGLKIKSVKAAMEKGSPVINIELKGTQSQYTIDAEYKGTILVIESDITVETLTPNVTGKIEMTFTNDNEVSTNKSGKVETEVNFVAPAGVVAANGISNYAVKAKPVLSIAEENANAVIDTYSEKQIATVTGKIVNNYGNKITDVVILGRIPAKGNVKIDTKEELGSTFDAKLNSNISLSGIDAKNYTIYYSNKADATNSLEDASNGWTQERTKSAKSYMVITKDFEMEAGDVIDFNYDIEIPANLTYNNSAYEMYKVYYNNVSSIGTMAEEKISPIIETSTGEGPELEINISSASQTVREGQIVKMIVTVKNVGELPAKNAKLLITAPDGTLHTELKEGSSFYTDSEEKDREIALGNIAAGETVIKEYELKIEKGVKTEKTHIEETNEDIVVTKNEYPGDKEISNVVKVSSDTISNPIQSTPYTLKVLEGDLSLVAVTEPSRETILRKGDKITYSVNLENISYAKDLENVTLHVTLPEGLIIDDVSYVRFGEADKSKENVTINSSTISVNVGKLSSFVKYMEQLEIPEEENEGDEPIVVDICTGARVDIECTVGEFQGKCDLMAEATANEIETHSSNTQTIIAEKVELEFSQKELDENYIKEGSELTYHFSVKNVGTISSMSNVMKIKVPDGLSLVKAEYDMGEEKDTVTYVDDDRMATVKFYELAPGKSVDVSATMKADLLPNENDKEAITLATLSANGFDETESNQVKVTIEYDEKAHQNGISGSGNSQGGNTPGHTTQGTYKITGTAWLDVNKDGKRDDSEKTLSNIPVVLLYKKDNSVVKDPSTKQEMRTTTGNNGTYQFSNVPKGEYLVLFLYDAGNYSITTYRADEVAETLNSDAIDINITFDKVRRVAGITDVITITDSNVRDMDIGLYTSQKFDLKLDKYVSKITRTTPTSGTSTFNYTQENGKVAKVEVLPSNIGQSDVVIEYTIVVTNEGAVSGYAKKIVDYLPEHVNFSTELNNDWYLSENGNIYNSSLENEKIEPGESKEVKLILTARMTENNLDTLNNNAEIYESYNEQGLLDIDSTAGNKVANEDDMSNADVVLSLVTGKPFEYITLIFGIAVLIGFSVYLIDKRVLLKKRRK